LKPKKEQTHIVQNEEEGSLLLVKTNLTRPEVCGLIEPRGG
jgi:hypothetical protein